MIASTDAWEAAMAKDWQEILDALLYRSQAEGWQEMVFILGMAMVLAREGQSSQKRASKTGLSKT
jgi:hypothetical protein